MVKELDCLPTLYWQFQATIIWRWNASKLDGQVRDAASAFVGRLADPREGDYIIDVCMPQEAETCLADKLKGTRWWKPGT